VVDADSTIVVRKNHAHHHGEEESHHFEGSHLDVKWTRMYLLGDPMSEEVIRPMAEDGHQHDRPRWRLLHHALGPYHLLEECVGTTNLGLGRGRGHPHARGQDLNQFLQEETGDLPTHLFLQILGIAEGQRGHVLAVHDPLRVQILRAHIHVEDDEDHAHSLLATPAQEVLRHDAATTTVDGGLIRNHPGELHH